MEEKEMTIREYNERLRKQFISEGYAKNTSEKISQKDIKDYFENTSDEDLISSELIDAAVEAVEAIFGSWGNYCEDIRETYK